MNAPLAALENVSLTRDGREVLRAVSLAVGSGERVALVGPNGAGKTTLLRVLAGLEAATSGVVTRAPVGVGYVPQAVNEHLFAWFPVERNVAMPRLVAGLPDALEVARALLKELLPEVDLARRAGRLSGGEKQALSIARALASPGPMVLADEPFSALGSAMRARAHEVMKRRLGARALLLVSHEPGDAAALCQRVIRLEDGEVVR